MKDLLLLVHDDRAETIRIQAAVGLVRLLGGSLACLDVDESGVLIDEIAAGTASDSALRQVVASQSVEHRDSLERLFTRERITWSWVAKQGRIIDQLQDEAAFHDLTIASTEPATLSGEVGSAIVSALVCGSRAPALLFPDKAEITDFTNSAVVAWDGSRPCIASLRAAVPLLARARHVTLVEIGTHTAGPPIERAAAYLRRHGIAARMEQMPFHGEASRHLLMRCRPERADYCVMGAFSRWRGLEAAFGGTTLAMLEGSHVPLLLAH